MTTATVRARVEGLGAVEKDGSKKTAVSFTQDTVAIATRLYPGVSITRAMQLFVDKLVADYREVANV